MLTAILFVCYTALALGFAGLQLPGFLKRLWASFAPVVAPDPLEDLKTALVRWGAAAMSPLTTEDANISTNVLLRLKERDSLTFDQVRAWAETVARLGEEFNAATACVSYYSDRNVIATPGGDLLLYAREGRQTTRVIVGSDLSVEMEEFNHDHVRS